jgi:hypothetical protein
MGILVAVGAEYKKKKAANRPDHYVVASHLKAMRKSSRKLKRQSRG